MDLAANIVGITTDGFGAGLDVGKSVGKAVPTQRRCTVEITNECSNHTLSNPRVHTESGRCFIPFPPVIGPSAVGEALFSKVANTARGAVGVFTFDIIHNTSKQLTGKIAVMYKVPFNLNLKQVGYAIGVVSVSRECNKELFHEMSKETNEAFTRGKAKGPSLTYRSEPVTIMATMSNCDKPVMKVYVSDS